ncbi:MAG: hypothetical protein GX623_01390 [Clostridiales bacterium]|nr:hypothetical protein [Clostridiales bacterium]
MIVSTLLTRLLPVLVALGLGVAARRTALLDGRAVSALKTVVARITLPFVILRAFYKAEYSGGTLVVAGFVLLICLVLLGAGYLLRRRFGGVSSLLPFTLTGFEMGMLGFPLFLLLAGAEHMPSAAVVDLGHEVFVFTLYLFLLRRQTGERQSLSASLRETAGNPVLLAVFLGLLLGASGLAARMEGGAVMATLDAVCEFVSAPTAVLILLAIGYELDFSALLLRRAATALLLRLLLVLLVGGGLAFLLFRFIPYDPYLLLALMMMLSLPAPFVLPVYSKEESEKAFLSVFLSLNTLAFILLYALLLILKPAIAA